MEITDLNTALKTLNEIEDRRDTLRTKYEKQEGALRAAREQIEIFLLEEMKRLGLQAFEAPGEGVATIRVKRRFGVADWGVFWKWVVDNACPEMMQKRLLDSAVQTYLEANGGLPPAVNTEARQVIAVTKRPVK